MKGDLATLRSRLRLASARQAGAAGVGNLQTSLRSLLDKVGFGWIYLDFAGFIGFFETVGDEGEMDSKDERDCWGRERRERLLLCSLVV